MLKYLIKTLNKSIFVFVLIFTIIFIPFTKSFSEENLFTINNVKIKGTFDLNFSREKYLNRAFLDSFEILMKKILLTRDLEKVENVKLKEIKNLITSFQILEESYRKNIYQANINVLYNEIKIKNFLREKSILFSQPDYITVVFFPIFFVGEEIKDFDDNFFYKNWNKTKIDNELINFILPIEDLEDISKITEMKDRIEDLDVDYLVNKYDVENYVFTLMNYRSEKFNVYLKTNFNNKKVSKNISYDLVNINDKSMLNSILLDLKIKINDLWKGENLVNLFMPLSIEVNFKHNNLEDFEKLRKVLTQMNIIDNYTLEEFNIKNSSYKIFYYGNPKKLRSEFAKFGYKLLSNQGNWEIYLNE